MMEIHLIPVDGRGEQTTSAQLSLQESCASLEALACLFASETDW